MKSNSSERFLSKNVVVNDAGEKTIVIDFEDDITFKIQTNIKDPPAQKRDFSVTYEKGGGLKLLY